jgi:hypothetical protein
MSSGPGANQREILAAVSPGLGGWGPLVSIIEGSDRVSGSTVAWRRAAHHLASHSLIDVAYSSFDGRRRTFVRRYTSELEGAELLNLATERAMWRARATMALNPKDVIGGFEYQLPVGRESGYQVGRELETTELLLDLTADREGKYPAYPGFSALLHITERFADMSNLLVADGLVQFDTWWMRSLLGLDLGDPDSLEALTTQLRQRATARFKSELRPASGRNPVRRKWLADLECLRAPDYS